jgi:hypothetical protein
MADMTKNSRARRMVEWAERFEAKVDKTGDCWLWRGSINGSGYGTFLFGSRTDGSREAIGAHRFSYELANGAIADGLEIHHTCFTPSCVNLDHLAAVTNSENLRGTRTRLRAREAADQADHQHQRTRRTARRPRP